MCTELLLDRFIDKFPHNSSKRKVRTIGLELEFPVVQKNGEAVKYETIKSFFSHLHKEGWQLSRDGGTNEITSASRSPQNLASGVTYSKDVIGTDVGYCTLETSLTPENSLVDLEKHWLSMRTILHDYFIQNKSFVLGYGVQPVTPPNKSLLAKKGRYIFFEQDSLNRFIDQRVGVDLHVFATSAASQVHLDIYRDEAIRAINIFNGLAPLFTALTANASVWKNHIDPEWIDIREIFWDKSWSNRIGQIGIPDAFDSFSDYVERVSAMRPQMVKRRNEFIKILYKKTIDEYFACGNNNKGETVKGKVVHLKAEIDDLLFACGFMWWQARLSPYYGTLEIRMCGQQPPDATICVSALSLGILENLNEAERIYKKYSHRQWQLLRFDTLRHGLRAKVEKKSIIPLIKALLGIAKQGLKNRNLGEEKYLEPLYKRLKNQKNPADEISIIFKKKGVNGLIKRVAL